MVGLLYFVTEERDPWYVSYIVLQRKEIHGRYTIFC